MSRSFGDRIAQEVGVSYKPGVKIYNRRDPNYMNAFIVIGSDGLWDFIPNQKMLEIVAEKFDSYFTAP
jgi:serine/threonine protein phosphatase PrpC